MKPPALDDAPARPTVSNEALREEKKWRVCLATNQGLQPLDRPVVPQDRISDKATMMGGEALAPKAPPQL